MAQVSNIRHLPGGELCLPVKCRHVTGLSQSPARSDRWRFWRSYISQLCSAWAVNTVLEGTPTVPICWEVTG